MKIFIRCCSDVKVSPSTVRSLLDTTSSLRSFIKTLSPTAELHAIVNSVDAQRNIANLNKILSDHISSSFAVIAPQDASPEAQKTEYNAWLRVYGMTGRCVNYSYNLN